MPAEALAVTNDSMLQILDTFHDFCTKERKKKAAGNKITDEGDDEIDGSKLDQVRSYIKDFLKKKYSNFSGAGVIEIKDIVSILTLQEGVSRVTNLSDFENNIVTYFETYKAADINVEGDKNVIESITFEDIVKGWDTAKKEDSPLWREFRRTRNENTMLEINKGTKSIDTYDTPKKNIIGNFILNYFFGTSQGNMRCTFDAKAGVVSKIFEDIDQVKNVIFPQTIADSATTTFGTMRGRNEFIFPDVSLKSFTMESSLYSRNKYTLSFENNNFDNRNPYGFNITIQPAAARATPLRLPFSPSQTEGPSVNYLIDILLRADASSTASFSDIVKKKQILSLGKYLDANPTFKTAFINGIRNKEDGLLFDIKRAGDHEAVAATKYIRERRYPFFMFVTIDLLCALESRKKKNPTIQHYGERMRLYRFPVTTNMTPELKKKDTLDKIADATRCYTLLKSIKTTIGTELTKALDDATLGKTAYVDVYKGSAAMPAYQKPCEQILISLLQYRMTNLVNTITVLRGKAIPADALSEVAINAKLTELVALETNVNAGTVVYGQGNENYTVSVAGVDKRSLLNDAASTLDTYVKSANTALGLSVPIGITATSDTISKSYAVFRQLVQPRANTTAGEQVHIIDEVGNPSLDYDALPFFSLYRSLILLSQGTEKATSNGKLDSRGYTLFMKNELLHLQTAAQGILDQFDSTAQTALKRFLLFKEPKVVEEFRTRGTTRGVVDDFIAKMNEYIQIPPPKIYRQAALQGGGKRYKQKGGAYAQQYFDLADTLKEVTGQAASFMESCYTNLNPVQSLVVSIGEFKAFQSSLTLEEKLSLFENIYAKLITNLCTITSTHFINASVLTELTEIKGELKELLDSIQTNIHTNTAQCLTDFTNVVKKLDKYVTKIVTPCAQFNPPRLAEFYDAIATKSDFLEASKELVVELQLLWESALYLIQTNEDYTYTAETTTRGLTTTNWITMLLSLRCCTEGSAEIVSESFLYNDIRTTMAEGSSNRNKLDTIITNMKFGIKNKATNPNVSIPILMVLAMLDNLQTQTTKHSFFINPRFTSARSVAYNTEELWNTSLWNDIDGIIAAIHTAFPIDQRLPIQPTLAGGGKRYAKRTRKTKRKARRQTRRSH